MDFLTKLPKDLIDHILYFLLAKEGARRSSNKRPIKVMEKRMGFALQSGSRSTSHQAWRKVPGIHVENPKKLYSPRSSSGKVDNLNGLGRQP
ncbi:hypothetical protein TIFTF001_001449 [Ficus carica]|uniref:Uncharacterized protein n=1 Tax=Ficus carica TaxID=3494 RepID=A0AA87ZG44_FICCA|nr:hypothetical protein TIFTF001_001449 [Ficus carica]